LGRPLRERSKMRERSASGGGVEAENESGIVERTGPWVEGSKRVRRQGRARKEKEPSAGSLKLERFESYDHLHEKTSKTGPSSLKRGKKNQEILGLGDYGRQILTRGGITRQLSLDGGRQANRGCLSLS